MSKINITEEKFVEQAVAGVKAISGGLNKSKAYYNVLAALAVQNFLTEKGLIKSEIINMHSSARLLADFEIADIQLPNLHVDVRAVFDENLLFIPKKHFENKILPDVYLFVKFDEDLQNVELLGFVKPSQVNKQNENEEYYFVNNSILSSVADFENLISSLPAKNQYVIADTLEETLEKLVMLYMDHDIDDVKLEKLIDYLKNSIVAREKLIEFENFERLSYMALQEFKDLDVNNNDFSKYIKTLVSTDEFAQFENEADELKEPEVEDKGLGLFFDEPVQENVEEVFEAEEEAFSEEIVEPVVEDVIQEDTSSLLQDVAIDEDENVEELPIAPIVDEFEAFDAVDEFDMSDDVQTPEILENSVINEEVETTDDLTENIQGEDLELKVDSLDGFEQELLVEEPSVEVEDAGVVDMSNEEVLVVEDVEVEQDAGVDVEDVQEIDETVEVSDIEENIVPELEVVAQEEIVETSISEEISEVQDELVVEDEVNVEISEEIVETSVLEEVSNIAEEVIPEISEDVVELSAVDEVVEIAEDVVSDVNIDNNEVENVLETEEVVDFSAMEESFEVSDEVVSEIKTDEAEMDMPIEVQETLTSDVENIIDVVNDDIVQQDNENLGVVTDDIVMDEVAVDNVPEVAIDGMDMAGVVTDDISFMEDGMDDISEVVTPYENVKEQDEEVSEEVNTAVHDELTLDDLMMDEVVAEQPQNLEQKEMVSDADVDKAIADAGFTDDELDALDMSMSDESVSEESDLSLEELLMMENDLQSEEIPSALNEQIEETVVKKPSFVDDDDEDGNVAVSASDDVPLMSEEDFESSDDMPTSENSEEEMDAVNEEGSDFAFAVENKQSAPQKNLLVPIAALVTIIGLAGAGAWYFLFNGNKANTSSYDIADNSGVEDISLDMADIVPADDSLTADIMLSDNVSSVDQASVDVAKKEEPVKKQEPAKKAEASKKEDATAKKAETATKDIKPLPEQLTMQKIKKDFSQPNTYLSVSKIVWDVPEYLTYNDDFSGYLQQLGSSVKLNLSSDLLLVTENTLFNKVKVKIQLKDSGKKFSAEITDGSGAKAVDDVVLQSVKKTLNLLQPPVNSLDTADEDLFITIYL